MATETITEAAPSSETAAPETPVGTGFMQAFEKAFAAAPEPTPTPTPEPKQEKAPEPEKTPAPSETRDLLRSKSAPEKTETKEFKSVLDEIAEPEFKAPEKRENWKQLKEKGLQFERELSELKPKYSELEEKLKAVSELEENFKRAQEREKDLAEKLQRADVAASPEFREKYVVGRQKVVDGAVKLFENSGVDSAEVKAAMELTGQARVKALADLADQLPAFLQGSLGAAVQKLDAIDGEAAEKLSKSGDYWREVQEQRQKQETEQREMFIKQSKVAFESALKKLRAESPLLQEVSGNQQWNSRMREIVENAAKQYETNDSLESAGETHLRAAMLPHYQEILAQEMDAHDTARKELEELRAELKKIHGGAPGVTGKASSEIPAAKRDFITRFNEEFNR